MPLAKRFFTKDEQQQIVEAISEAEKNTSGEIRVHIENLCFGSEVKAAQRIFNRLKMFETKERNGVLIYIATLSRKVAIVGDEGIHQKLGQKYWFNLIQKIINEFKANHKVEALVACIRACGNELGTFFPIQPDDTNELSNEISYR